MYEENRSEKIFKFTFIIFILLAVGITIPYKRIFPLDKNVEFKSDTFTNGIIQTQGYYHRGYACQLDSGCNNYSPYETGYAFKLTDIPARIHIKL